MRVFAGRLVQTVFKLFSPEICHFSLHTLRSFWKKNSLRIFLPASLQAVLTTLQKNFHSKSKKAFLPKVDIPECCSRHADFNFDNLAKIFSRKSEIFAESPKKFKSLDFFPDKLVPQENPPDTQNADLTYLPDRFRSKSKNFPNKVRHRR